MKLLWFEVTEPSAYSSDGAPIGGWQDSLERIVRTIPDIELTISFVSEKYSEVKVIDGVTYVPIYVKWSFIEKKFRKHWDVYVAKMLPTAKRIIDEYKPDLIHVFGTEWPFGQVASVTDVPVVIHIMGAIMLWNTINAVAWAFLFAKTVTTLINYYSLMVAIEHPYSLFLKHIMAPFAVGVVLFVLVLCYNRLIYIDNMLLSLILKTVLALAATTVLIKIFSGFNLITFSYEKIKRYLA